jgi:hypothetical protein
MMARSFNELRTTMSPASRKRAQRKAEQMIREEMRLRDLRIARRETQQQPAESLQVQRGIQDDR